MDVQIGGGAGRHHDHHSTRRTVDEVKEKRVPMIRAGRWCFETSVELVRVAAETILDGVAISEELVSGPDPAAWDTLTARLLPGLPLRETLVAGAKLGLVCTDHDDARWTEVIARRHVTDTQCVVAVTDPRTTRPGGRRPSELVAAYAECDSIPAQAAGVWLEHGAVVGVRCGAEDVAVCWTVPKLQARVQLETCVVPRAERPDLVGAVAAMQDVTDLADHGIAITVLEAGEHRAAGLMGETLRYRMMAPDGDVYQAIWCFGGTPDSISEPWARVELTAPAILTEQAEQVWAELLAGLRRDVRA